MPSINVLCFVTTYLNSQTSLTMVKHRVLKHCLQHWFLQTNASPRGNAIWWSFCLHVSNNIFWFIICHFPHDFHCNCHSCFFLVLFPFWQISLLLLFPMAIFLMIKRLSNVLAQIVDSNLVSLASANDVRKFFFIAFFLTFFLISVAAMFVMQIFISLFPNLSYPFHLVSIAGVSDVGEAGCPIVRIVPGRVEMLRLQPELTLVNRTNTTKTDSRSLKPVLIFISLKYIYLNNFMKNAEYLTLPLS